MPGLSLLESKGGIAPYGIRHSGEGVKGLGFFGALPNRRGGYSTELSAEDTIGGRNVEYPLLVPTLSAGEIFQVLSGGEPSPSVYAKARAFAEQRLRQGLSPFASPQELRLPLPQTIRNVNGAMPVGSVPLRLQNPLLIGVRG